MSAGLDPHADETIQSLIAYAQSDFKGDITPQTDMHKAAEDAASWAMEGLDIDGCHIRGRLTEALFQIGCEHQKTLRPAYLDSPAEELQYDLCDFIEAKRRERDR